MRIVVLSVLIILLLPSCEGAQDNELSSPDISTSSGEDTASPTQDISFNTDAIEIDPSPQQDTVTRMDGIGATEKDSSNQIADILEQPDAESQEYIWGTDFCPPLPEGINSGMDVGDQLPSMGFQNCLGEAFDLNELCGADATWIFFAHSWCGDCQATAGFAETVNDYFAANNVAIVQIVVHSFDKNLPTAADCATWQDTYGLSGVLTLFDPIFLMVQLANTGQTGQSVFLDKNRVIKKKAHIFTEAGIIGEIQEILTEQSTAEE